MASTGGGALHARQGYYPYGETRYATGPLPTDYQFTGQRSDSYIKLVQMGARWYNPQIGRWISADTIIPDFANPQSLNRYSYVLGNPLKFTDPTGHCIPGVNCPEDLAKGPFEKEHYWPGFSRSEMAKVHQSQHTLWSTGEKRENDCGPTSVAMAASLLDGGGNYSAEDVARWMDHGIFPFSKRWKDDDATPAWGQAEALRELGFDYEERTGVSEEEILAYIDQGTPIITTFIWETEGAHALIPVGYDPDWKPSETDPNKRAGYAFLDPGINYQTATGDELYGITWYSRAKVQDCFGRRFMGILGGNWAVVPK